MKARVPCRLVLFGAAVAAVAQNREVISILPFGVEEDGPGYLSYGRALWDRGWRAVGLLATAMFCATSPLITQTRHSPTWPRSKAHLRTWERERPRIVIYRAEAELASRSGTLPSH